MTDRLVVLAVVVLLGTTALVGLLGVIWLIDGGAPAESLLAVTGIAGPAAGALAGVLATTRTQADPTVAAVAEQAQAAGAAQNEADLRRLDEES